MEIIKVCGRMLRRRSLGKHLAFASVLEGQVVQELKFNDRFDRGSGHPFPARKNQLIIGSTIEAMCVSEAGGEMNVVSWEVTAVPSASDKMVQAAHLPDILKAKDEANRRAQASLHSAARSGLCRIWARQATTANGCGDPLCTFRHRFESSAEESTVAERSEKRKLGAGALDASFCEGDEESHGSKEAKGLRARIFADGLAETMGLDTLRQVAICAKACLLRKLACMFTILG